MHERRIPFTFGYPAFILHGYLRLGSINLWNAVTILERVGLQIFHGLDQGSDNPAQ